MQSRKKKNVMHIFITYHLSLNMMYSTQKLAPIKSQEFIGLIKHFITSPVTNDIQNCVKCIKTYVYVRPDKMIFGRLPTFKNHACVENKILTMFMLGPKFAGK